MAGETKGHGVAARLVFGSAIGGAALWLAARGIDWSALRQAMWNAHLGFVGLALIVILATLVLQAVRWRLLFYPDHCAIPWRRLFNGVVVSQMLNIVVPARLGEVARVYSLESNERVGRVRIVSTIVVEKALDLCGVAIAVALLLATAALPAWLSDSGKALLTASCVVLAGFAVAAVWSDVLLRHLESATRKLPGAWGRRIASLGHSTVVGLSAVGHGRIATLLWAATFALMILAATTNYLLFLALGLSLPPVAALFLLIVLQVGIVPPSLPGKLGVFNYLVVLGLSVYSIDRTIALGYSLVLYVVAFVPKVLLGAGMLMTSGWREYLPGSGVDREGA